MPNPRAAAVKTRPTWHVADLAAWSINERFSCQRCHARVASNCQPAARKRELVLLVRSPRVDRASRRLQPSPSKREHAQASWKWLCVVTRRREKPDHESRCVNSGRSLRTTAEVALRGFGSRGLLRAHSSARRCLAADGPAATWSSLTRISFISVRRCGRRRRTRPHGSAQVRCRTSVDRCPRAAESNSSRAHRDPESRPAVSARSGRPSITTPSRATH